MKKTIGLSLLLCISIYCKSQDYKLDIHFSPLSLVDRFSHLRLGASYLVNANNKISFDYGFAINNSPFKSRSAYANLVSLNELRVEYQFYHKVLKKKRNFGIELFYIHNQCDLKSSFYAERNGAETHFNSAFLDRKKYGLNLKMIHQHKFSKQFLFEYYYGIGFAQRNIDYTNVDIITSLQNKLLRVYSPRYVYIGISNAFTLNAGFKLSYRFLQHKK